MHLPNPSLKDTQFDYIGRIVFARRMFEPTSLPQPLSAWQAFTPVFTNLVNVGSPTLTGRFQRTQGRVHFQVKIVPATTSASTAGTTFFNLPVAAAAEGIGGDGSMGDLTTLIAIGDLVFDMTNSRCYTPTKAATADAMTIAGWYEG